MAHQMVRVDVFADCAAEAATCTEAVSDGDILIGAIALGVAAGQLSLWLPVTGGEPRLRWCASKPSSNASIRALVDVLLVLSNRKWLPVNLTRVADASARWIGDAQGDVRTRRQLSQASQLLATANPVLHRLLLVDQSPVLPDLDALLAPAILIVPLCPEPNVPLAEREIQELLPILRDVEFASNLGVDYANIKDFPLRRFGEQDPRTALWLRNAWDTLRLASHGEYQLIATCDDGPGDPLEQEVYPTEYWAMNRDGSVLSLDDWLRAPIASTAAWTTTGSSETVPTHVESIRRFTLSMGHHYGEFYGAVGRHLGAGERCK